jgi:monoamine oxidase
VVTGSLGEAPVPRFDPPLPPELRALGEIRVDPGVKITAVLPAGRSPVHRITLGGQPVGGAWRYGRRVCGFALSEPRASDADLRADLAAAYHADPAELGDVLVFRWDGHPTVGGCDIGFAPGQLTRLGPRLAQPHGRVFFAGAERSSWPNNMEGAVESGLAAADRVAQALAR